ncbi:MAG: hypothetical protein HY064_04280 [Bacteroidetes bacterium]|nr:hypothetical protein [Bacteroidota bacterium]
MTGKNKIRVAILCRKYEFESWEAGCIREVLSLPSVEIVLLIAEEKEIIPHKNIFQRIVSYPYRNFLWRFFKRFRLKIPAMKIVSMEDELKHIPIIHCQTEKKGKYSEYFTEADLEKISSQQPDVILRFAFNIIRGKILTLPRYGVWSFHHADEQLIRGGPGGFWEIYFHINRTGAILQRLTEKLDGGIILRKGWIKTIHRSYKANLDRLLYNTTPWMKQALIDIQLGKSPALAGTPVRTEVRVYTFPRNAQMIRCWLLVKKAKWSFRFRKLFRPEKWHVAVIHQSKKDMLDSGLVNKPEWLPEPAKNEYYADPFGWKNGNEYSILFEHYSYKKKKGVIAGAMNYPGTGIKTILEKKEHLSYPFVLQCPPVPPARTSHSDGVRTGKNEPAFIPECFQSGRISLYSGIEKNNPAENILLENFPAVDTTLLQWKNKFWIFCTKAGEESNTSLYIFHADDISGKWSPHSNNPVKCDIASARPAGTPFVVDGKLFRPAQDCSKTYGGAVVLQEVVELSAHNFSEREVQRLEAPPQWKYNRGLHTISFIDEDTLLVDAKRFAFNFDNFRHQFSLMIRNIFRS